MKKSKKADVHMSTHTQQTIVVSSWFPKYSFAIAIEQNRVNNYLIMGGLKRQRDCTCCRNKYQPKSQLLLSMWFDRSMEHGLLDFLYIDYEMTDTARTLEKGVAGEVASLVRAREKEIAKHHNFTCLQTQRRLIAPLDRKELKLGRILGRGGFSKVYEVSSFNLDESIRKFNSHETTAREFISLRGHKTPKSNIDEKDDSSVAYSRYAIKHLDPSLIGIPEKFAKAAIDIVSEAQMLLCLDHPHIIKLRGWPAAGPDAFKDGTFDNYFLVLDRLVDTLEDRIWLWRKQWKREIRRRREDIYMRKARRLLCLPSKPAVKEHFDSITMRRLTIAYDLADAIEYIHSKRIICRDVKSTNIGFDINGDVKLFDFGLSRFLPKGGPDDRFLMTNVGTRSYTAPEISLQQPYNQSADIYSFGVVLWEMMALSSPKKEKYYRRLAACPCWPLELQTLVTSMILLDYNERPSIMDVKNCLRNLILEMSDAETSAQFLKGEERKRRSRSSMTLNNPIDVTDLSTFDSSIESA